MSTATSDFTRWAATRPDRSHRLRTTATWTAQFALASQFAAGGVFELAGDPQTAITNVVALGTSPVLPLSFGLLATFVVVLRRSAR
jgi:hypothetical protein